MAGAGPEVGGRSGRGRSWRGGAGSGMGALTAHERSVAPGGAHAADVGARVRHAQRLGAEHLAPAARAQRLPEAAETEAEPGPGALLGHGLGRPLPAASRLGRRRDWHLADGPWLDLQDGESSRLLATERTAAIPHVRGAEPGLRPHQGQDSELPRVGPWPCPPFWLQQAQRPTKCARGGSAPSSSGLGRGSEPLRLQTPRGPALIHVMPGTRMVPM